MTTTIDRELIDLLTLIGEEGLISNAQRASLHDKVAAGRVLHGLDDARYELRREFDERFLSEREADFPGTPELYRDLAEHGVFRNLGIKGRIEPHERRIYNEFAAVVAALPDASMVPAIPFITPEPLTPAGRIALVNEVLEHGIDPKSVIFTIANDGLNDGMLNVDAAARNDRGLRFHSEFFAETQDPDNDLFREIMEHGLISEKEYTRRAPSAHRGFLKDETVADRVHLHILLTDYRNFLVEQATAEPFEVTGRELIVARARVNGVIEVAEYNRLTRLAELGSRMTEKQIRQCTEFEAFVAEFGDEADKDADAGTWPHLVHRAIKYGMLSEADRDDVMRRDSEIDIERARTDVDYEPNVYGAEVMNAVAHDQFFAAAATTYVVTPVPATSIAPTGRELVIINAKVNGVIGSDEYKRLARLVELGSRMTEKQIRQCAEYEAFVAEFKDIADEKAEGLPYSAWHAISFGLAGEAERDESLRREAAIDRDRWVNDDDYDPGVTALDSIRAARHDQFLADAGATVTAPPRPTWQAPAAESAAELPAPKVEGTVVVLNEDIRTYRFATGDIELHDVRELIVRGSGTHRLRDAAGRLHVIAPGWLAITIVDKSQEWTV